MRNSTCVICFKEFAPREGKLYCSNACKQKGYADNKLQAEATEKKTEERKVASKQLEISYADYQEYKKKYPNSMDSFLLFSFFRKNFTGVFSAEQFYNYINSFDLSWWEDFWEEKSEAWKKYREYEAKYFGDEVVISFSEKEPET
jgi:hypothetical protein